LGFQGVDNSGEALVGFMDEVVPAEDDGEPGDSEEGGVVGVVGMMMTPKRPRAD
jgi:hypothetical protein